MPNCFFVILCFKELGWMRLKTTGLIRPMILTIPLPSDLIPRIAITPWIIVDSLGGVNLHVLLRRTATVEICNALHDALALGRNLD